MTAPSEKQRASIGRGAQLTTITRKKYQHRSRRARLGDLFGPPQEWSRADEHWSVAQWQATCAILFNGNTDPHEFLLCHQSSHAKERFNKAKRAVVSWHVEQAYKTIAGTAERPSGIGYYPWNGAALRLSYWGAFDFDAHEGQSPERARELAARLVAYLRDKCPTLAVIACRSGASGGWHVFIFRTEARPIAEWSAFLRKLANEIGATVGTPEKGGDCELHPIETTERPRGIRAPGSLNPKNGSFGLIAFDSLTERLVEWRELLTRAQIRAVRSQGTTHKTNIIVLCNIFLRECCSRYAITSSRTRHKRLQQLVGFMVNRCGHGLALRIAAQQYKQARPDPKTELKEHLAEFGRSWQSYTKKEVRKFGRKERQAYAALKTDVQREGFLMHRCWRRQARMNGEADFHAHCKTLAARLGLSLMGASRLRTHFCERGIMKETARFVPHKLSARYKWLLDE